jgi:hypothetical protein
MSIQIKDYPSVSERAEKLGVIIPTHLAILPDNFDTADSCQY